MVDCSPGPFRRFTAVPSCCPQGHYPVVREDAAQMCALQIQAEHASTLMEDLEAVMACIEKYVTKQVCEGVGTLWCLRTHGVCSRQLGMC